MESNKSIKKQKQIHKQCKVKNILQIYSYIQKIKKYIQNPIIQFLFRLFK